MRISETFDIFREIVIVRQTNVNKIQFFTSLSINSIEFL